MIRLYKNGGKSMFGESHVQTGAGRYFQCHGALKKLGSEVADYGEKIFVLYADDVVKAKTNERVETSLKESNLAYKTMIFQGPSTADGFLTVAKEVKAYNADVVVGVGGGRIIDIAKAVSNINDIKVFTVPTSAATCAAYAVLYVEYGSDGRIAKSNFLKHEISGVLADLDYILDDCPLRYFASGIADAMAKSPEFTFTSLCLGDEGKIPPVASGTMIAGYTWQRYIEDGTQAIRDFELKTDSALLDDFVNMNIMMTGLISNLSVGGKSLALAHNYYDAICCLYHEIRANYLHGELVGMALPLQMYVNGALEEEIYKVQNFLKVMKIPTTLEEIGFPKNERALEELVEYVYRVTMYESDELKKKIREGMHYLQKEKW